eukprot:CAMPEP_0171194244 /NCGR_PEP_ID=MMETSP0790-20130122/20791_1 /TAXON_ID=2925 /ORGANISM="Alexandrium catenella, Strain OF101" /LENGTH=919 /DNA_ID=CAMNT_0011659439 /DNA_START=85 /DNA_END=2841 /DNA_ORIENTATION=+
MQVLPAKDQAVFRSIVKFYETKQYKKGVKAADSILKKHPDHGETLCMKGLTLSYLEKKEEAYELVRKGLKHDLKSHVCWHVYGLLYRQDKDYQEAVKCYRQALRIDPDNLQILRDLSLLQIHSQDLTGFAETRRKLLQVKPSNRLNWVGYAIAEHLCKSHEFAWTCIENYEKTFKDDTVPDYENSELFMYRATIMEEAGKLEEALECLRQHERSIVDKIGLLEMKGRLCMYLQRYAESAEIFRRLVRINPEHQTYVLAYMASQQRFHRFWPALPAPKPEAPTSDAATSDATTSPPSTIASFPQSMHPEGMPIWGWLPPRHSEQAQKRVSIGRRQHKWRVPSFQPLVAMEAAEEEAVCTFFDELQADHSRSDALQQLILYFVSGTRFQRRLDDFLRPRLRKGIPSLFRAMRSLYFQGGKAELVEELLLRYIGYLEQDVSSFGPRVGEENGSPGPCDPGKEEPPTSLLFTLMITAYHFDFVGDTKRALQYADRAMEHTPTLLELYTCKARIYRHGGDLQESAKWFEEARQMDLADRFLNTQCVRALLRVDDSKQGMEKALMFSKEPDSPGAANLHDMQCMAYESCMGRSYRRQQNLGKALKMHCETFRHFGDIAEDKFDFHNYCLRKTTLRAYVAMLRMQEKLYSHKFFRRAAKDAISIYLQLYDRKARGEATADGGEGGEGKEADMSAAEKKKLKFKKQREAKKAGGGEKQPEKAASGAGGKVKKVDDDPDGLKLLEKDPMEEASKLVKTLVIYCDLDPTTHVITYDVFSRQGRLLHCLQALIRLWQLGSCDSLYYKLIAPLAHFCFVADLEAEKTPSAVRSVILSELAPVLKADGAFENVAALRTAANGIVDAVEQRLKTTSDLPLIEVLYGLKCLKHAGRSTAEFLAGWSPTGAFALKDCGKLLAYLGEEHGKDSAIW